MTRFSLTAIALDKRKRVLSVGRNSYLKTHPLQARYAKRNGCADQIFLHAEIAALIKAKHRVHRLVVVRNFRNGKPACSRPCKVCMDAIMDFGVKVLEYIDLNGNTAMEALQ